MNNTFSQILDVIKKSDKILITAHISPDGDAIGGGLALLLALKKLNITLKKEAKSQNNAYFDKYLKFVLEDNVPKNLKFLKSSKFIEKLEDFDPQYEFDLIICVDSGNFNRVGKVQSLKATNTILMNIDHHISNDRFGDYNYVGDFSSTSEILFDFFKESEIELDYNIAEALYTGIVNDTGNFKHSNTTKKVFKTASVLLEYGVKPNEIIKKFIDTKSLERLKLTGHVLSGFKYVEDLSLVYYYLSERELEELGASKGDTEGLAELLLSYENASVSLILRQDNQSIKGSFRSKNDVDVNALANLFNGGGHIKAAGFKTDKSSEEILEIVFQNMNKKYIN